MRRINRVAAIEVPWAATKPTTPTRWMNFHHP
jgi:hypothetical protein